MSATACPCPILRFVCYDDARTTGVKDPAANYPRLPPVDQDPINIARGVACLVAIDAQVKDSDRVIHTEVIYPAITDQDTTDRSGL
jgi:hypothetical protein